MFGSYIGLAFRVFQAAGLFGLFALDLLGESALAEDRGGNCHTVA